MLRWGVAVSAAVFVLATAGESVAETSCTNGRVDGTESDTDCGGACLPCDHGRACASSRDCLSGRCAGSLCEERSYIDGDPVPYGYRVVYSDTNSSAIARTIGLVSLGIGYGAAYATALVIPGEVSVLYLPVLGPWIAVADESTPKRGFIALDGALQTVGISLLIGGMLTGGSQLLREDPEPTGLRVQAGVRPGGRYGFDVSGAF